jgi:hypothetical protein
MGRLAQPLFARQQNAQAAAAAPAAEEQGKCEHPKGCCPQVKILEAPSLIDPRFVVNPNDSKDVKFKAKFRFRASARIQCNCDDGGKCPKALCGYIQMCCLDIFAKYADFSDCDSIPLKSITVGMRRATWTIDTPSEENGAEIRKYRSQPELYTDPTEVDPDCKNTQKYTPLAKFEDNPGYGLDLHPTVVPAGWKLYQIKVGMWFRTYVVSRCLSCPPNCCVWYARLVIPWEVMFLAEIKDFFYNCQHKMPLVWAIDSDSKLRIGSPEYPSCKQLMIKNCKNRCRDVYNPKKWKERLDVGFPPRKECDDADLGV